MANYYYLNKNRQPSGDFEVHQQNCTHGAQSENQIGLGWYSNSIPPVAEAKRRFTADANDINGCAYCSPESNNG